MYHQDLVNKIFPINLYSFVYTCFKFAGDKKPDLNECKF